MERRRRIAYKYGSLINWCEGCLNSQGWDQYCIQSTRLRKKQPKSVAYK